MWRPINVINWHTSRTFRVFRRKVEIITSILLRQIRITHVINIILTISALNLSIFQTAPHSIPLITIPIYLLYSLLLIYILSAHHHCYTKHTGFFSLNEPNELSCGDGRGGGGGGG